MNSSTSTLEYDFQEEQGYHIMTLVGEIDLESSPKIRSILLDRVKKTQKLFIDMAGVEFIDSSGIATLVEAFQLAKTQGGYIAFVCLSPSVVRVFTLARLDKVFSIHESVESALYANP